MVGNWIKLHRKIIDSRVFADADLLKIWLWCLCRASYRERQFLGGTLQPGQFITGRHSASTELGIPPSTFLRRLKRLEQWDMIAITPSNQYSIITILNWSSYQHADGDTNGEATADPTKRTKTKVSDIAEVDISEFVVAWNAVEGLSPITVVTDARRGKVRTRLRNKSWKWREALAMLPLPGEAGAWQPDFDWFVRNNENALGIVEGKYNWRKNARSAAPQSVRLKA